MSRLDWSLVRGLSCLPTVNVISTRHSSFVLVFLLAVAFCGLARADEASLEGVWESPFGRVRFERDGSQFVGRLVENGKACGLGKGADVVKGEFDGDVFTGETKLCFPVRCRQRDQWVLTMAALVDGGQRLVAAVAPINATCADIVTKGRPFFLSREGSSSLSLLSPSESSRPKRVMTPEANRLYREGLELAQRGQYETARQRFIKADKIDPNNPDILNQIGITWYARADYERAETYYRQAIATDVSSTVAQYNLACVLAKTHRKPEALEALRDAVQSGYGAVSEMDTDPDLASIRSEAAYQEIRELARRNSSGPH